MLEAEFSSSRGDSIALPATHTARATGAPGQWQSRQVVHSAHKIFLWSIPDLRREDQKKTHERDDLDSLGPVAPPYFTPGAEILVGAAPQRAFLRTVS